MTSVTTADVLAIRRRYAAGTETLQEIGQDYGVSLQVVFQIGRGKTWRRVPGFIEPPARTPGRAPGPLKERFEKFVMPEPTTGCWLWTGAWNWNGYGKLGVPGKPQQYAHRVAYELWRGPVGDAQVCHRCDVPSCVNPAHLFLGTAAENAADKTAKHRQSGDRNAASKLTAAQVVEIRRLYREGGVSQEQLGQRFGVSQVAIGFIVRGQHWKHIQEQGGEDA